ncbi:DsbA family protein [Marinigracilibium pacificum]|uniref:DsbA family protein n=1 Tax=Marinigracilibium pacificum TaxID=2729599 RepID=A0A848J618_9BACT|nr:DsbA family protein [Marinigracilibium pacificum]NMM50688.1 DsbA family protein [Marinigracilibium pacificum]
MNNKNPLLCNPATGICEMPENSNQDKIEMKKAVNTVKIVYFTDPICSSCWGIEPQLRKLKLEYGSNIEIEYRMGGLLPDWSYNSGGISKPSDVAHHWDEVSLYYDMPIEGDIWLEDPLDSSYPPSIAFKAAQLQNQEQELSFLRELKEMVFIHKKNISKWIYIEEAATKVGLNTEQLKFDYENKAKEFFQKDLKLAKDSGVRGFPTLFFYDTEGNKEPLYGFRPYENFELAIQKISPGIKKHNYSKNWKSIFNYYNTLTTREFREISGISKNEADKLLNELAKTGEIDQFRIKNGTLWKLINNSH